MESNQQPYDDSTRLPWVGMAATLWVQDHAPVPTELFPVLSVLARYADENGRGSHPSQETVASKTGKSAPGVKKDLARLRGLGLIRFGDQSLVSHLPADRRPKVYDLAIETSGPKPAKESKNKSGIGPSKVPRGGPWKV